LRGWSLREVVALAFAPPVASVAEAGARLMKIEASNRARAKLLPGKFFIGYPLVLSS